MPGRKEIQHSLGADLYSIQIYAPLFFEKADPNATFEKWAAVEVSNFDHVPHEMETYVLAGGLYVVFDYKGLSSDPSVFQYILGTWLPNSDYVLDDRPHFEVLGHKYKNNDPTSEEEIWVPIKPRQSTDRKDEI